MSILTFLKSFFVALVVGNAAQVALPDWDIKKDWREDASGYKVFESSSLQVVKDCSSNPDMYLRFPSVVHGAHRIFLDGKLVQEFGDWSFSKTSSFYGSPSVPCSKLVAGNVVEWQVRSYSDFFARINEPPSLTSTMANNLIQEGFNLVAAGGLFAMFLLSGLIFWRKVDHKIDIVFPIAVLMLAQYFISVTLNYTLIQASMLNAHKYADTALWIGGSLFFYCLYKSSILSRLPYMALVVSVVAALPLIIFGADGDYVQLGTSIPFLATGFCCINGLYRTFKKMLNNSERRYEIYFQLLSLSAFFLTSLNDIAVVNGLYVNYMVLPIGVFFGCLFFAFAVNEKINQTYAERDHLRENLELEVERKTEKLQTAYKELKSAQAEIINSARLAGLGTMAAGIAHEINNSLNYVNSSVHVLEKKLKKSTDLDVQKKSTSLIAVIKEGLELTFKIIESLRSHTGLNKSKFSDVNLHKTCDSVLVLFKTKIAPELKIENNISKDLVVFSSEVSLHQIFSNLISNAIDALGGKGWLKIYSLESNDSFQITFEDNAGGIPKEHLDRLMEPFYTTKQVGKGTGLGLFIVNRELGKLEGDIKIDSEVGKGTKFILTFPKAIEHKEAA